MSFRLKVFFDEVCRYVKRDQFDYRLEILSTNNKSIGVLTLLLEKKRVQEYKTKKTWAVESLFPRQEPQLLALSWRSFAIQAKELRLIKLPWSLDCGICVNPAIVKFQLKGATIMGIGAAIFHNINIAKGRAVEKNFPVVPDISFFATISIAWKVGRDLQSPTPPER